MLYVKLAIIINQKGAVIVGLEVVGSIPKGGGLQRNAQVALPPNLAVFKIIVVYST